MKFKIMALEVFAILVSYMVFSLSLASATSVSIMFNGQIQETANYEQENLVNMLITMSHQPNDITWTNVKLAVKLNSASLANSIKKIYLYKCRSQTPTECVRSAPQVFDNYVDTELLWKDISEKTGSAQYPQIANLLFIVKLEDTNNKENWAGFFTQTKQTSYNIFDTTQLSLKEMEVHAKSLDLVEPIKAYIENKMMIPFKWATKVVFSGANPLYGIGATGQEADSHSFQTAVVPSSEIASINKDFYFVAPKISSGIANPIVLNLNPSFACGNGICESDIGETSRSCCYDCGCAAGQFCDTASNINLSVCKSDNMSLSVISANTEPISDCARGFNANISVRVSNPPASLSSQISGTVKLNNTDYNVMCSGSSGSYGCAIQLTSSIKCGGGSYVIGPGILNLTATYKDGPNSATKSLGTSFSGVAITFDCKCQEGSYCDSLKRTCQSENAITLGITRITSYLDNYNPGDRIYLSAKIFNPPAGLVLVDKSATMNLTNGQVFPGTPDCSAPNSQFEYNCTIPFQISGYTNTQAYSFSPNTLYFTLTYNDGPLAKTKTISAPFGPVSIPSRSCGDNQCNMDESQQTCCLDCGCPSANQFCDKVAGCIDQDSVSASVSSINPVNFTDCRQEHTASIGVTVNNAPTDMSLDYSAYLQNGLVKGWNLHCEKSSVNLFNCTLVIPPLESEGCSLPFKTITGNSLNMTLSFPNGKSKQITKHLAAPFQDIYVTPVYHCGDGTCESSLGESPSNCCYDCSCKDSPAFGENYYCDFDPQAFLGGCLPKSNISLVIDSPTAPVSLSSCELTNSVNIKAHISNQPKNARPEYFYASVNGTSAEMIHCDQQQVTQGSNYTFNCTLMIPKIYQCSQGQTYTFDQNSLSVLLSYENGKQKTETQTLSASLPTITVRQGIRTLYDITQEGIRKMQSKLKDTMQTAREMLDAFKSCMETVKTIGYMTLIAAIAGGIWAGTSSPTTTQTTNLQGITSPTQSKISTGVSTAVQIGQLGTSLMTAYGKMCEYLNTMYQMDLQVQQLEMKMIQMDMCMESNQHMLDIGQCNGREQSCFQTMVSCVNFNDIQSWASQLTTTIQSGNNALAGMNTALTNAGNQVGILGGGYGSTILYIRCGGDPAQSGTSVKCCSQSGLLSGGTAGAPNMCNAVTPTLYISADSQNCKYPVVYDGNTPLLEGSTSQYNFQGISTTRTYNIRLYCFPDSATYSANKAKLITSQSIGYTAQSITFTYYLGNGPLGKPNPCTCDMSTTPSGTTENPNSTAGCCKLSSITLGSYCLNNLDKTACENKLGTYVNGECAGMADYQTACLGVGTSPGCCIYNDVSIKCDNLPKGICDALSGSYKENSQCLTGNVCS